ncbi:hypothetical protein [uncultured Oscillibacter sp.]|uniref:hypothetical protein n=1 Tax=uncultured Oscillibacter sp. TaxID=876091 RepID=UPI00260F798B|nr:hypothetical protein [uncultured Oscillibacter sp.]
MEAAALLDAHVQLKRIYTALSEALDVTRQLADAVDRDDRIAVQMLVSMRQEPTDKLSGAHQALEQQRQSLPAADAARLAAILKGGEAETEEEAPLAGQVGANQRILKQLVDLDRVVNRKLAREKSIYK